MNFVFLFKIKIFKRFSFQQEMKIYHLIRAQTDFRLSEKL